MGGGMVWYVEKLVLSQTVFKPAKPVLIVWYPEVGHTLPPPKWHCPGTTGPPAVPFTGGCFIPRLTLFRGN